MKHFYNLLIFIILLNGGISELFAQNNSDRSLQFIYIDHEATTPTALLNKRLTDRYYDVVQFPDFNAMIVYLSNGRRSPAAFVNLKEFATRFASDDKYLNIVCPFRSRDTEDAFKVVLETMINSNSHDVEPAKDIDNILTLLEQFQVFADDGTMNYQSLRFDFYIGPKFWSLLDNERVIARLYSLVMQGLSDQDKDKVTFNVFKPSDTQLDYTEGKPFGDTNLDGINKISIMEY